MCRSEEEEDINLRYRFKGVAAGLESHFGEVEANHRFHSEEGEVVGPIADHLACLLAAGRQAETQTFVTVDHLRQAFRLPEYP